MRVTVEAPSLGRAVEMHQEQQLLQREAVDGAETIAELLLDAGMGAQQGEHGGEGGVGHGGDIGLHTSICKYIGIN